MDDRLIVTEADIEEAQQIARAAPVVADPVTIDSADIPPASDAGGTSAGQTLQITEDDLTAVPPQTTTTAPLSQLEQRMFDLVNEARERHLPRWLGNRRLRWHAGLAAVARGHAADMQQRQYVDHSTPEGIGVAKRLERFGINYLACGENIGVVYGPASHSEAGVLEIHSKFMQQPRSLTNHRGNLLNPIWTHVGIGITYHTSGVLIATQVFMMAPGST